MIIGIFFLVSIGQCLSEEWTSGRYAPMKEIDVIKNLAVPHGKSHPEFFKIPAQEEFPCEKIHNLTMAGFADDATAPPSAAVDDYLGAMLKDFDDSSDRKDFVRGKKENILKALKLKIQFQIEDRIKNLAQETGREARSSHSGFPSMESALVSISLLLFAVYLIKLVMKLIYTFHFKKGATEVVGLLSNIRQPLILGQSRQEKSFDQEIKSWKMRNLIEEQHLRFN